MDKPRIRLAMRYYLKAAGWERSADQDAFVIKNLKPMFKYLLKLNLVKLSWYANYEQAAILRHRMSKAFRK